MMSQPYQKNYQPTMAAGEGRVSFLACDKECWQHYPNLVCLKEKENMKFGRSADGDSGGTGRERIAVG